MDLRRLIAMPSISTTYTFILAVAITILSCCNNLINAQQTSNRRVGPVGFHNSGAHSGPGARILRGPESTVAPVGDEVLFQCELSLTPERLTWLHQPHDDDGDDSVYKELDQDADFRENGYSSSLHSTTASLRVLAGPGRFGSGRFRCSARFGPLALVSVPAKLTLAALGDFDLGPANTGQWAGATTGQGLKLRVPAGNRVTLMCPDVESSPKAVIQFYKFNKPLSPNIPQLPSGAIVLPAVTEVDSGRYTCSALNDLNDEVARTTVAFTLQVYRTEANESPRFLQPPRPLYTSRVGRRVLLECSGVGQPVPIVQWSRQGATIITPPRSEDQLQTRRYQGSDSRYRSGGSSMGYDGYFDPSMDPASRTVGGSINQPRVLITEFGLQIENVTLDDAGIYECTLLDPTGRSHAVSHHIRLEVDSAPEIITSSDVMSGDSAGSGQLSQFVQEGARVELACDVSGSPPPKIYWMLNARPAVKERGVTIDKNRLIINPVSREHAGAVQCFAKNRVGETFQSGVLQVAVPEVTSAEGTGGADEGLELGQMGTTKVTAASNDNRSGEGRHHYHGRHESGDRHQGGSRGNGGNKKGHRGKDGRGRGRGRDKKRNRDAVMIPPTRPNVTRLSDESVMVRWSVPKNDGLEISFFKVQYRDLTVSTQSHTRGHKGWITTNDVIPPHIRSYEVNNLETEHFYRFRIAAVYSNNDNKLGPNSERFHLQRGEFLGRSPLPAPVLLRTEALGPNTVQIHWQYTADPARPADGFYLYFRPASTAGEYVKATVDGERTRSWRVDHLDPDTTYELKVQSFTATGASDFSAILTQRTSKLMTEPPTPMVIMESGGSARHEAASGGGSGSGGSQGGGSGGALVVGGGAAGGAALLALAAMMAYVVRKRRKAGAGDDEEKDANNDCSSSHDKSPEPSDNTPHHISAESNGYITASAINPHSNYQVKTVQITANGCARVNITSNPLAEEQADKNASLTLTELEMEMSMLSQNNNMSGSSAGSSSRTNNSLNSVNSGDQHQQKRTNITTSATSTVAMSALNNGNGVNHHHHQQKPRNKKQQAKHHQNHNVAGLQRSNEVSMNSNSSIENYV